MKIEGLVTLLKPNRTYFTGEIIHGQVIIINRTEVVQRLNKRLYILFCGVAATNLLGTKIKNDNNLALVSTDRRNSIGKEVYLEAKIFLTPVDSTQIELAPGSNGFPFEYELPFYIPSSFYGSLGRIEYKALTSFSVSAFLPHIFSYVLDFYTINCQDLTLSSMHGRNSYFSFEKLISFGSTKRRHDQKYGLINTAVKLPSQGFIPGEAIHLSLQMVNQSGLTLDKVNIQLVMEIGYTCPAGSANEKKVLNSLIEEGTRCTSPHQQDVLVQLEIPQNVVPTTSQITSIISIEYFVIIDAKLESARNVVTVGKIPIVIGSGLRELEPSSSNVRQSGLRSIGQTLELEGDFGGDTYVPSAPLLEHTNEQSPDEFPPSYFEAIGMAKPP